MTESIMQSDMRCYVTGKTTNLHRHHAMPGTANRKKSEKYGLWVWLEASVHARLHDKDKRLEIAIKMDAQRAFEERYGHDLWMKEFGRNYLDI